MKTSQAILIILGFILLALMATNPSIEDHREGVKKMYKEKVAELNKDKKDDLATQIGTSIGMLIGDGLIDKMLTYENYLLFSLTYVTINNESKNLGIGILGFVYIQNFNDNENKATASVDLSKYDISTKFKWIGKYRENVTASYRTSAPMYCFASDDEFIIYLDDDQIKMKRYNPSSGRTLYYSFFYQYDNYIKFKYKEGEYDKFDNEFNLIKVKYEDGKYFIQNLDRNDCPSDYEYVKFE